MPIFGLPSIFEEGYKTLHDEPKQALGSCYVSNTDDKMYSYVRFAEDVKEGHAVRTKFEHFNKANISPATSGGSDFPAAGSQKISEHDAAYETSLAGIPKEPTLRDNAFIRIYGGTGIGQEGYITHYTNKVLNIRWYDTNDGTLKTALGADSDYEVWAPWYMEKAYSNAAAAVIGPVNGVVLTDAKKNQYGLIGVRGIFRVMVSGGATVDRGRHLIPALTAQQGEGVAPGADDVIAPYATLQAHSANSADGLVLASVHAVPIAIVEEISESLIRGFERPAAV